MKTAVVGVGGMGLTHLKALRELAKRMDLEVTALADVREVFWRKAKNCFRLLLPRGDGLAFLRAEDLVPSTSVSPATATRLWRWRR